MRLKMKTKIIVGTLIFFLLALIPLSYQVGQIKVYTDFAECIQTLQHNISVIELYKCVLELKYK